jgi:hypothetical protein
MDINTNIEGSVTAEEKPSTTTTSKPTTQNKPKKPEGKKPAGNKPTATDTRGRAKSTLQNPFESKKAPTTKKETKPVETIGSERFQNLKAMFEKKPESKDNNEDPGPKKLEMDKLSAFNKEKENTANSQQTANQTAGSVSDTIKKRMEMLLNANKNRSNTITNVDPVLEHRKKMREMQGEDGDEEDEDDDDMDEIGDDDHISEEEDNDRENKEEKELGDEIDEESEKLSDNSSVMSENKPLDKENEKELENNHEKENIELEQEIEIKEKEESTTPRVDENKELNCEVKNNEEAKLIENFEKLELTDEEDESEAKKESSKKESNIDNDI